MNTYYRLAVVSGPPYAVLLSEGTYLLGRSDECDVQLPAESVSRRHARLEVAEDQVLLSTLTKRRTLVDDVSARRGEEAILVPVGARLVLGACVLELTRPAWQVDFGDTTEEDVPAPPELEKTIADEIDELISNLERIPLARRGAVPLDAFLDEMLHVSDSPFDWMKRRIVRRTVQRCDGNKSEAARLLGIDRKTVRGLLGTTDSE